MVGATKNSRSRTRWHLWYTLLRNPELIRLRKSHLIAARSGANGLQRQRPVVVIVHGGPGAPFDRDLQFFSGDMQGGNIKSQVSGDVQGGNMTSPMADEETDWSDADEYDDAAGVDDVSAPMGNDTTLVGDDTAPVDDDV